MRILSLAFSLFLVSACDKGSSGPEVDLASGAPDLTSGSADPDAGPGDLQTALNFSETFPGADTTPWPSRWTVLGGVASQGQFGGRGRLVPTISAYSLARMGTTAGARDVDVTFQLQFESIGGQGIGYYVRQNGGWLRNTVPNGQGYAVFIEGFRGSSRMGVWREIDGQEEEIQPYTAFAMQLQSNMPYNVRFRVTQATATTTRLQARLWAAGTIEPTTWQIDTTDASTSLQNISGGMAVDSYNSRTTGTVLVGTLVGNILAVSP